MVRRHRMHPAAFLRSSSLVTAAMWATSAHLSASAPFQVPPPQSPALALLARDAATDPGAVDRFWSRIERDGAPLVEPADRAGEVLLTFVYRADADVPVRLTAPIWALHVTDLPDFETIDLLEVLPGTDVHHASFRVRDELRLSYAFEVGEGDARTTVRDPLNPHVYMAGTRFEESSVTLDGAPHQPWADTPAPGEWRQHALESDVLERSFTVRVYEPVGSGRSAVAKPPFAVLIGLDAISYADIMPTASIVEYLMARGDIPPTLLVAAPDLAWVGDELGSYDPAAAFIADELLPMLRREYEVSEAPASVVLSGLSRRGMISSYIALRRPEAVGRVLSLSGSYYWRPPGYSEFEWVPARFAEEERRDIRLYLAAGELETLVTPNNRGHYMVATNRHMRDVLRARGYEHRYAEFYGVHSTFNWQDQLAPGLEFLLGGETPLDPTPEPRARIGSVSGGGGPPR